MVINKNFTASVLENRVNRCGTEIIENGVRLFFNRQIDFVSEYDEYIKDDAFFFYQIIEGDFTFSAQVSIQGSFNYDAVFLMVRQDETNWIKLAVERDKDANYNVVSVITDNWPDDANGELLTSGECWLRITRKGNYWGLHYSLDGLTWRFVRALGLALDNPSIVGYGIQSPVGDDCVGVITNMKVVPGHVQNFRDGT